MTNLRLSLPVFLVVFVTYAKARSLVEYRSDYVSLGRVTWGSTASAVARGRRGKSPASSRGWAKLASLRSNTSPKQTTSSIETKESTELTEDSSIATTLNLQALAQPLIPDQDWNLIQGDEYIENSEWIDQFTQTSITLAENDESNEWIEWSSTSSAQANLDEGDVLVWTGKARQQQGFRGANLPFIKTRSVIPMTPPELTELLMDSQRVKTYNPWSLGRVDLWQDTEGQSKIVKNKTKPPVGSKLMVGTTFLHARPLENGAWIVVSRAVGGKRFHEDADNDCGLSEILLGVNLIRPLGQDSSILTAITHVYSSAMPQMLAERLGVKSSVNFVKSLRSCVIPA